MDKKEEQERRANDMTILRELSEMRTTLNMFMRQTGEMVKAHQRTLHGENGDNGVTTTVSKHKDYFAAIFWLLAALTLAVIGMGVSKLSEASDHDHRVVSQEKADR